MAQRHGKKRADITAVARHAGVSASTVSRFFNHPDLVRPDTRKRIERSCEKLGYVRNRYANTLRGLRSGSIGLIVPTVDNAIFAEMIQSFADQLNARELTLLTGTHGYDQELEAKLIRSLLEHRVDGIAVVGLERPEASRTLLTVQGIPSVALWNYAEESAISCVGPQNLDAGRIVAKHVVDLGHENIATIFPEFLGNDRARDRYRGAQSVFEEAGIAVPLERHITTPYNVGAAKIAAIDLLRDAERPSAVVCGNDIIARGVIFAAQALGLDIPRDVSVVGIGDFAGSAEMEPGLTSVRMPARRIGRLGAQILIDAIESGDAGRITRRRFELKIVKRRSTGAWRGGL